MGTWIRQLPLPAGEGPRLAVKDCIDVKDIPTTAGCPVVAEMADPAHADAAVVASARAAGARIAGKTTLSELCWSANGVNHWAGTPVNPRDARRVPGGSSSGSAVAVAAGEADVGYGSDTGGSIRIPAACCAIAGLKTTYGRLPVAGVYPLAPSLDTVGPLGRDVAAVELGMALMEPGFAAPPWSGELAACDLASEAAIAIDPQVAAGVRQALAAAGVAVATEEPVDFRAALAAAGVIIDAEGFRSNSYLMSYLDALSPHIQRNLERGARLTRSDIAAANQVREDVTARLSALLERYPVLVCPTLAGPPPLLGEHGFPLTMLTVPANLAGLPALSLPVPAPGGVIASLQVTGRSEERVVAFARVVEEALGARQ